MLEARMLRSSCRARLAFKISEGRMRVTLLQVPKTAGGFVACMLRPTVLVSEGRAGRRYDQAQDLSVPTSVSCRHPSPAHYRSLRTSSPVQLVMHKFRERQEQWLASHLLRANRGGDAHIACVTSLASSRSACQRLRKAIIRPLTLVTNYERKRRPASECGGLHLGQEYTSS